MDYGIENFGICEYMEQRRGPNRGSALRGKSCHNQRIERLWVDVWENVANEYHDLFMYLEERELLDVTNLNHTQLLHIVFCPRINASLNTFKYQYNHHGLSTENYKSPIELFITGVLTAFNSNRSAIRDLVDAPDDRETEVRSGEEQNDLPEDVMANAIKSQIDIL